MSAENFHTNVLVQVGAKLNRNVGPPGAGLGTHKYEEGCPNLLLKDYCPEEFSSKLHKHTYLGVFSNPVDLD